MPGKRWSKDEIAYLEQKWGVYSTKAIAKRLGRTTRAVRNKAWERGLPCASLSYDGITLHQLAIALQKDYSTLRKWIKTRRFPAYQKIFYQRKRIYVVKYKHFWEWAEKNYWLIDFSKLESRLLGPEPKWVNQRRKGVYLPRWKPHT